MTQVKLNEEALDQAINTTLSFGTADKIIRTFLSHPAAIRGLLSQMVKPLEWEPYTGDDNVKMQFAQASIGRYVIHLPRCAMIKGFRASYDPMMINASPVTIDEFPTIGAAKAACGVHHTEQVLKLCNLGGRGCKDY